MDAYKYDHPASKHKFKYVLFIVLSTAVLVGGVVGTLVWLNARVATKSVSGTALSIPQNNGLHARTVFDESLYSFQLPSDWKVISTKLNSITWQATIKDADNRMLTIYTDAIPTAYPVNRELPLRVSNNQISFEDLSDNCANFTPGGTLDTGQAVKLKPAPSVWHGVNFICNLPQVIDNQVGTGSTDGVNTVTITGPVKGTHNYFFLYIDRNVQPDYTILYSALQSFRAK